MTFLPHLETSSFPAVCAGCNVVDQSRSFPGNTPPVLNAMAYIPPSPPPRPPSAGSGGLPHEAGLAVKIPGKRCWSSCFCLKKAIFAGTSNENGHFLQLVHRQIAHLQGTIALPGQLQQVLPCTLQPDLSCMLCTLQPVCHECQKYGKICDS